MSLSLISRRAVQAAGRFLILISVTNCGDSGSKSNAPVVESASSSLSGSSRTKLPDQVCDIKGGLGRQLRAPFTTSADDCSLACQQYAYANPNRICLFGSIDVALRADCEIVGGLGVTLTPIFRGTRGECTTECQKYDATNPNRVCKFAYMDIAPQAICNIKGGLGAQLAPIFQGTRGQCQLECNKFSGVNPNRVCDWSGVRMTIN